MLTGPEAALDRRGRALVAAVRRGWRLGHLTPAKWLIDAAARLGYRAGAETDLGPFLRLDRWRDRALRLAGPLADALGLGRWPLFANMIGGNALTQAHRTGILGYRLVVLQDGTALEAGAQVPAVQDLTPQERAAGRSAA